jgi:hypothetical protein
VTECDEDSRDDVESSSTNEETSGKCVLRAAPSLDRTDEIVFLGFQNPYFSRSAVEDENIICDEFSDIAIFASGKHPRTLSTTGQSPSADDLISAATVASFHFEERGTFKKVKKLD